MRDTPSPRSQRCASATSYGSYGQELGSHTQLAAPLHAYRDEPVEVPDRQRLSVRHQPQPARDAQLEQSVDVMHASVQSVLTQRQFAIVQPPAVGPASAPVEHSELLVHQPHVAPAVQVAHDVFARHASHALVNHAQLVPEHAPPVGPADVPVMQRLRLRHQPHVPRAAHVPHVVLVAHGSGHAPQSPAHVVHVSPPLHEPSPHRAGHAPQSPAHDVQVSPPLHVPSPHRAGHAPQSPAHDVQVSPPLHVPSPHRAGHAPQSPAHDVQVSPPLHVPSPHRAGHAPQSPAHDVQVSPPLHVPSPHRAGHAPQSPGHDVHVSPPAHVPSPHIGPQPLSTAPLQSSSIPLAQVSVAAARVSPMQSTFQRPIALHV